uniref:Centromere protein K n=1 Tax=Amazona collaria TaxID=241587 RepID=A0A8B9FLB5_9PSIT
MLQTGLPLQKVKDDLDSVLSAVQSKNKSLEEDLKREQQWYEEQKQLIDTLSRTQEEAKKQVEQVSNKRAFNEQQKKILQLKIYKKKLLTALGKFLEEHFPSPEKGGTNLLRILVDKSVSTPHEPYVPIDDSFWPPYLELLLRHGIAQRHPENPDRIRLEAFHE